MAKLTRRIAIATALAGAATPAAAAPQEPRTRRGCLVPTEPELSLAEAGDVLARAEFMIDALRAKGWLDSDERAARCLAYFRDRAMGKRDGREFQAAVVDFLRDNGQSLDWLLTGDVCALICRLGVAAWVERNEPV